MSYGQHWVSESQPHPPDVDNHCTSMILTERRSEFHKMSQSTANLITGIQAGDLSILSKHAVSIFPFIKLFKICACVSYNLSIFVLGFIENLVFGMLNLCSIFEMPAFNFFLL